jgi:hypothetical protein
MSDSKDDAQAILAIHAAEFVPGERWRHYKGGRYEIVALALKEDNLEPMIVYRSIDHGTTWIRSIGNFIEPVLTFEGTVRRFEKESI